MLWRIGKHIPMMLSLAAILAVAAILTRVLIPTYSLTISLDYDGASEGLSVDGTAFDPFEMLSDSILSKVSDETGHPVEELEKSLSLSWASTTDRAVTDYVITANLPFWEQKDVLESVARCYESSVDALTSTEDSVFATTPTSAEDLFVASDLLSQRVGTRLSIAKSLAKDDQRYDDIVSRLRMLQDISLPSLRRSLQQNGYGEHIKDAKVYADTLLRGKLSVSQQKHQVRLDAIELYDPSLFPTVSIPFDDNGTYRISTTKTGLDDIYLDASFFVDESETLSATIKDNEAIFSNAADDADPSLLSTRYEEILATLSEIDADYRRLSDGDSPSPIHWEVSR